MRAMQFTKYGVTPVLDDVAEPTVGEADVLVRVSGAALNPMDVKIGLGYLHDYFPITFPTTVGTDVSGTVERVGAQVTGWAAGDRVIARLDPTAGGAVAEFAVIPAAQLVRAPESVSLTVASGLCTAAATAYQALVELGEIQEGLRVLIHGGTGGVGAFAVQMARRLGAYVATTVSPKSTDLATRLGAHQVIDYTMTDFRSLVSDIDLVIDPIGGETELASLDVLKPGGLLLGLNMPPDVERATGRGRRAQFLFHTSDADRLAKVADLAQDGLEILVERQVPLNDAVEAYEHVASGHAKGKVIVTPR
jgi:NADPH:quinone reductase-like Zn-dependent oxidoreductase